MTSVNAASNSAGLDELSSVHGSSESQESIVAVGLETVSTSIFRAHLLR